MGFLLLFAAASAAASESAGASQQQPPHIVLVLSDDLGYNDLGYKNGNKTITPNIDALVREGIQLSHYHTFKLCSPTRASIQSGRYPWGVGFYDMQDTNFEDGNHCINPATELLPSLLKKQGYQTHASNQTNMPHPPPTNSDGNGNCSHHRRERASERGGKEREGVGTFSTAEQIFLLVCTLCYPPPFLTSTLKCHVGNVVVVSHGL